jgi:hypothetical protein
MKPAGFVCRFDSFLLSLRNLVGISPGLGKVVLAFYGSGGHKEPNVLWLGFTSGEG